MKKNRIQRIVMRLKILNLLLILTMGQAGANVVAQNAKINFSGKDVPMEQLFHAIQKQTEYRFIFNHDDVAEYKVTGRFKDLAVDEILKQVFNRKPFTFSMDGNVITVSYQRLDPPQPKAVYVRGIVKDQKGELLPGVTIRVKGVSLATVTDESGRFELALPDNSNIMLVFTFVGMKMKEVKALTDQPMEVFLEEDVEEMEEVVVTGIFERAKESYTGAVTTVTEKELKTFRGQNLLQTLRNIDPAFNIVSNNELGSDPNHLPEVNIRGTSTLPMSVEELNQNVKAELNTPLIIMDGFEISLTKLMDMNDDEIAGITILKDASATAIYGSRGANGVVVVTTKIPEEGRLKVSVSGGLKLEIPDLTSYDVLNAADKLELERMVGYYDGKGNMGMDLNLKREYNRLLQEVKSGVNTDWLAQPLHTGISPRLNLRLDGGSSQFRWSVSLGYNQICGAMKESQRNNFSGNVTLSYYYKNLIFKNQTMIAINKALNTPYGSFHDYVRMNPYWRIEDEEGDLIEKYSQNVGSSFRSVGNPLYNATLNVVNKDRYKEITNNLSIEWKIFKGLQLRARFGISTQDNSKDVFKPSNHTDFAEYTGERYFKKGQYSYTTGEQLKYEGNIMLNYSRLFLDNHQLNVGVEYSVQQQKDQAYTFKVEGFPYEEMDFLSNALFYVEGSPEGKENTSRRVGVTGNMNYIYHNRYFLDASFRVDGSSQFGSNNKFAPFYSFGVGWNLHHENFLENNSLLNICRLKASYGSTGSQQFSAYQALSTYVYYASDRYLTQNGVYLKGLGNEDLKWQKTDQYNVGIELAFLQNRIRGTLDVYQKVTRNMLSQVEIPSYHGFRSYTANVGKIQNRGFEAMLTGYLIRNTEREMIWSVTGRIAYNQNRILRLSEELKRQTEEQKLTGAVTQLLYEGDSQNALYVVRSLGIDPSNGREAFLKQDGSITYEWDARDRIKVGESQPKYQGNINTMFQYHGFSATLSFAYHFGGVLYNNTMLERVENADYYFNVDKRVFYDRWKKPGDIVTFKSIHNTEGTKMSSRFVQKDKVLELQAVNLSYRFDSRWVKKMLKMQNLTVGANLSDIFYLSSIKRERGTSYPFARRMEFTVSMMF